MVGTVPIQQVLLTAEEVAHMLAVPKSWVYSQARQDRIPHVKLGHYTRFDREAVAAWWRGMQRGGGPRSSDFKS